jgi:uncharacterized membrane protein YhhN
MRHKLLYAAALIAGISFYLTHWVAVPMPWHAVWKGTGVTLLALWAARRAKGLDGWLIVVALAFGAAGDVVIDAVGLVAGAVFFLAGHLVAVLLYFRHRRLPILVAPLVATGVAWAAYLMPADRNAAYGIWFYACGLGLMAGSALASRFPLAVKAGAVSFVVSDLLIFAEMGPLAGSPLPGLLIWPTYFAAQALIAWGVVTALERR